LIVISDPTGGFSTGAVISSSRAAGASGPSNKPSSRNHPIESRIDSRIGRYVIPSSRTDFPFSIDAPVRRKSASHDGRRGGDRVTREKSSPVRAANRRARPPMCRDGMGVPEAMLAIRSNSPHRTFSPEMIYRSPTRPPRYASTCARATSSASTTGRTESSAKVPGNSPFTYDSRNFPVLRVSPGPITMLGMSVIAGNPRSRTAWATSRSASAFDCS